MIKFEKVSRFADADFNLPVRKTKNSAGYDFEVAEDIILPSYESLICRFGNVTLSYTGGAPTLEQIAQLTKSNKAKPTLVSTGVKCHLEEGYYLELSVRSSTPLKYWIILANSVGIIDADYCDNPDNEGEIFFQVINLSPFPIQLRKGDIIGQGIIKKYEVTDDDKAEGLRTGGFGSTTGFKEVFDSLFSTGSPVVTPQVVTIADDCGTNSPDIVTPIRGQRAKAGLIEDAADLDLMNTMQKSIEKSIKANLEKTFESIDIKPDYNAMTNYNFEVGM